MTVEEIKAKHQPRQLENQVEFDAIMSDINQQQGELNRPLIAPQDPHLSDILSPLWQGGGYKAGVEMRLAA